jgi:hypothetical protein
MAGSILKILRSLTVGNRPTGRVYGELYVNLGEGQFGVINNSGGAQDLIGVPIYVTTKSYAAGSPVNYGGNLYIAQVATTAGAFNPAQWALVVTVASPAFTGTPTAPTPTAGDSSTKLATTAFVVQAAATAGTPTVTVLTVGSGTYTTKAGCKAIRVRLQGGGGGGGNAGVVSSGQFNVGGGGGAGAYCDKLIANPAVSYPYTIGAGGSSAANGNPSTFGSSLLTAPGGLAGSSQTSSTVAWVVPGGGPSSLPTGGDLNLQGSAGNPGIISGYALGGVGGAAMFGGGGFGGAGFSGTGANGSGGSNPGSGGGGAANMAVGSGNVGGTGANGIAIIDEFY